MKKDIYMGLDKELVLNIIFNTSCKKNFIRIPIHFDIVRNNDKVSIETNIGGNQKYSPGLSKEQEDFIRENSDAIVRAWCIQMDYNYSIDFLVGHRGEEKELEDLLIDMFVEQFMKFKGISSKEELQKFISDTLDGISNDEYKKIMEKD